MTVFQDSDLVLDCHCVFLFYSQSGLFSHNPLHFCSCFVVCCLCHSFSPPSSQGSPSLSYLCFDFSSPFFHPCLGSCFFSFPGHGFSQKQGIAYNTEAYKA